MLRTFQDFPFRDLLESRNKFLEIVRKVPFMVHLGGDNEAAALYELAAGFHDDIKGYILEFGTYAGASASCMAVAVDLYQSSCKMIYTIDPYDWHSETMPIARAAFARLGIARYICQVIHYDLDFVRTLWRLPTRLIYVDAVHKYDHVIETLDLCYPILMEGGWLAIHDYGEHCLDVVNAVNMFIDTHNIEAYQIDGLVCIRKQGDTQ